MSEDVVNIEVDGRPLKARKGQMIMQLTDTGRHLRAALLLSREADSIAANCRMCLVEVEKAPKPMPACATPVAEGMKVFTRSARALAAQKATMEFLLINHPLDCPICDQGGECELQDLALGFGSAKSRFDERKRVVKDKNIGPLISTDMTRCIHCTRCVRFTAEIAGMQELGATGRGEWMEIGTWIEKGVDHELSGNVIDLCPVGALNSKPFRHRARSWEMTEHALVSPHDGIGTNLWGHVLRGRLMRVVPRSNEEINETWIADRDRYSYEGIYAADRLREPMMRVEGQWREVTWEAALEAAAVLLREAREEGGAGRIGFLSAPGATNEEAYLFGRLARGLGSHNIDSRLRQLDFSDQASDPAYPGLGIALRGIDTLGGLSARRLSRARGSSNAGTSRARGRARRVQGEPALHEAPAMLFPGAAANSRCGGRPRIGARRTRGRRLAERATEGPCRVAVFRPRGNRAWRCRNASHAFCGHPRCGRGACRSHRRDAGIPSGRRQCRGDGAGRRIAPPPSWRAARPGAGPRSCAGCANHRSRPAFSWAASSRTRTSALRAPRRRSRLAGESSRSRPLRIRPS